MDISIIIINYNNCNLLEQCIESISTYTERVTYEIIVVDNNSTKCNPVQVIHPKDNYTLIRNSTNLGFSKANNQAMEIAKGKYILYLNNDTLFVENTLKNVYDYIELSTRPTIIGCKLLNKDGSDQLSIGQFDSPLFSFSTSFFLDKIFLHSKTFNRYYLNHLNLTIPVKVDFVKGAFLFCSREIAIKLNGFDENYFFFGEEVDFCYRFKKMGGDVIYYPLTKIIHIGGASTGDNLVFKYENIAKGRIQFYQKHLSRIPKILAIFFHYSGIFIRIPIYFLGGMITFRSTLVKRSRFYFLQLFVYPKNHFNGRDL